MDVRYEEASIKTADNLKTIAQSQLLRDLSRLTLPEIQAATNLISQVIPAGNVPGIILSGLARRTGHRPPISIIKRDIDLLFQSSPEFGVDIPIDTQIFIFERQSKRVKSFLESGRFCPVVVEQRAIRIEP
jgi:hypothetical protein